MANKTEKITGIILFIFIALGLYFNANNEKRLDQQIEEAVTPLQISSP